MFRLGGSSTRKGTSYAIDIYCFLSACETLSTNNDAYVWTLPSFGDASRVDFSVYGANGDKGAYIALNEEQEDSDDMYELCE